jgi:hypothetical protein
LFTPNKSKRKILNLYRLDSPHIMESLVPTFGLAGRVTTRPSQLRITT